MYSSFQSFFSLKFSTFQAQKIHCFSGVFWSFLLLFKKKKKSISLYWPRYTVVHTYFTEGATVSSRGCWTPVLEKCHPPTSKCFLSSPEPTEWLVMRPAELSDWMRESNRFIQVCWGTLQVLDIPGVRCVSSDCCCKTRLHTSVDHIPKYGRTAWPKDNNKPHHFTATCCKHGGL